ncbi:MAG: SAM-dependent chlorinase/fluorinase [Chthonomonadales bacterium]|nr:SAM-dependent chlorinase/fluorinase [Chthonomonadales bacterium]
MVTDGSGPVIAITTDFGLTDEYVGVMKGVLLAIAPRARIVDLCHGVPPHDVAAGALILEAAAPYFAPGTVHLAVVDPGVGTERAAVAVRTRRSWLVGPDNGLLSLVVAAQGLEEAVRLTRPAYRLHPVSATFHGRDVFAPAAAHLAAGVALSALGEPAQTIAPLGPSGPAWVGGELEGHVLRVDRFGNAVTDVRAEVLAERGMMAGAATARLGGGGEARLARTFADVAPGEPVAYVGSSGRLEVAVRGGSAAAVYGLRPGSVVRVALGRPRGPGTERLDG